MHGAPLTSRRRAIARDHDEPSADQANPTRSLATSTPAGVTADTRAPPYPDSSPNRRARPPARGAERIGGASRESEHSGGLGAEILILLISGSGPSGPKTNES
jgi:hypothetical protein